MDFQYRIVIELANQEQVDSSYKLFLSTPDQEKLPDCATIIDNEPPRDWRISDWYIDFEMELEKQQDKDLVMSSYLGHGIIKLFKLSGETQPEDNADEMLTIPGDETMVSILFVPTYFTVHDLLHFYIGDDIINNQISHFRILRNKQGGVGYNFMVLMKFRDPIHAKKFKDEFNGKTFSKMDPETCHVVSIKEVVFRTTLFQGNQSQDIPYLLTDPFTIEQNEQNKMKVKKNPVELPTCPVCLEQLDCETTGLITIPCQHTFHCQCLDKWKNSRCPVCRYSNLRLTRESLLKQAGGSNAKCATCESHENLWICLICGNIGCGRYNSKHAIKHYEDTSHCFAMDMRTQRVWDYAGDNYVHRLVQNEVDGKLVEIGENTGNDTAVVEATTATGSSSTSHGKDTKDYNLSANFLRNKEYNLEYVQVLISQLESQREYFELKLKDAQSNTALQKETDTLKEAMEKMRLDTNQFQTDMKRQLEASQKQLEIDRLMIQGLQQNLDRLTKDKEKLIEDKNQLRLDKTDLEEQVKDLMFYLESQEKFKDASDEVKEGTIVIQQPKNSSKKKKKPKPKPKKH
ncbi:hypothetical protein NCAS_0A12550 [Naumovozyma castellii]|uniref:Uncharacterized protein n=1 Tax=Naumovozyma castellii TaxID=27288 RepID=G0V8L4_NAUCA|nr:hypothetical protein NCAS_0A12550 [Naumovozyma castellii CBS 4309]CCC67813.1 hypothetical protein NCAS_0A12550 [Naumovozyma castellii CBS 4309]